MEASSAEKCGYRDNRRCVKYWAHLGCWISPCYGPYSLGGCCKTYKLFILFSNFFSGHGKLQIMNQQILWHTCAQLQEVPDSSRWDEVKSSLPLSLEVQSSNKSVIWSDKSFDIITNAM
jgi:hypothetical protein